MTKSHSDAFRADRASKLLDRLSGVKQTAPGRWIARCPAHEDKSPSLSIRESDDGRVLIHDFGGCDTEDVLTAVGMQFSDLFTKPLEQHLPPVRGGFSARELLALISHECFVAALIVHDALERPLTKEERDRLLLSSARLSKAKDLSDVH